MFLILRNIELDGPQIQLRNITHLNRLDLVAQLVEHWSSEPNRGSNSTVVMQFFSLTVVETLRITSEKILQEKSKRHVVTIKAHLKITIIFNTG